MRMHKALRALGTWLLLAAVAGGAPAVNRTTSHSLSASMGYSERVEQLPRYVYEAVVEAFLAGRSDIELELVLAGAAEMGPLTRAVTQAGGEVLHLDPGYARVKVPVHAAESVPQMARLVAVGVNDAVTVYDQQAVRNTDLLSGQAAALMGPSLEALGTTEFRRQRSVSGQGVRVAVIDSGIDPGHSAFRAGSGSGARIVDWKDFTFEGRVAVTETVPWGTTYVAPGGEPFVLPRLAAAPTTARFGYWDEALVTGVINRDLDRNGLPTDRFGVLVLDQDGDGRFESVYVDTNNDGSFVDERPLRVYRETPGFQSMGTFREGRFAAQRVHFVVADLDSNGRWVTFGFDGHGHGTQVAGVIGANGSEGLNGVAPSVSLLALKAMRSDGVADWSAIYAAIKYAAENGADIINVSIGNLVAASRFDRVATESLNRMAREHGVLIILAADNTGPGLSSGTALGSPAEVLSVGAYYSPAMWKRDFDYVVPSEGVHWSSGTGPRAIDGAYVPSVIAPGGSPTTSPQWRHESGYTTKHGTSIAAAHATGAAALLLEAGRRAGVTVDYAAVKRAMELGAQPIEGLAAFEQGHGLIKLAQSFEWLRQLSKEPPIQVRARDGGSGLLARDFQPGTGFFTLTNLGTDLTRVNVVSHQAWVQTGLRSLTLPPGVSRELPVAFTPPQAPGVHTAFLTIHNQGRSGPTTTVPITYVRPHEMIPSIDYQFAVNDRLEVTRSRRYFFDIKAGTPELRVSARVLPGVDAGPEGTVQMRVFRPDGQVVYESAVLGANGQGLSGSFVARRPNEGVWEVVVTALPDRIGMHLSSVYALEAQARPGAVLSPLHFVQRPGTTATHSVTLANIYGAFHGRVDLFGLTRMTDGDAGQARAEAGGWEIKQKPYLVEDFTLTDVAGLLRLEIANPVPGNVDLDLILYRQETERWGDLTVVTQSVTRGSSQEVIEVANLAPGRYQVYATINGAAPQILQYQYRRLVAPSRYEVWTNEPVATRAAGEPWSQDFSLAAPLVPGRYRGYMVVRDAERGQTLDWIPFEVSVGLSELAILPLTPQLVLGRTSYVTLELREASTQRLVNAPVYINGARYLSRGGRVTVPVRPAAERVQLRLEVDLPGFQALRQELTLPVKREPGTYPTGISIEENPLWRRRLQSQLQAP